MDGRRFGRARWWCILDDDLLVFVERLVHLLARVDDSKPVIVGGYDGQGAMCKFRCNETLYEELHGSRSVLKANGGGAALLRPLLAQMAC